MEINIPDWVQDAVFYQIFPDRFAQSDRVPKPTYLQPWGAAPTSHGFQGGDLIGVMEKLDYLAELGVNALYLNPIFASAANHRYHTYDYFQVDPILGGNTAFAQLLKQAHRLNIRVILDGVFNHASRGFFQFNHLLECGIESPYRDWFHVNSWPLNAFNKDEKPNYAAWWGLPALPKFNTDTPAVREFLWRVGEYWLQQGIDGWRLDVPEEINDDHFWRTFRRRCKAINPDAYLVGELWGDAQRWLQGDQFDAQMNYLFTRAAMGFLLGDGMDQSENARTGLGEIAVLDGLQFGVELERIFNQLYHPAVTLAQMNMLGSHDTPRIRNVAQNDMAGVRLLYLCQMTMPGAPNIYYGDEIGMAGAHDPDNRRAFPWADQVMWDTDLLAYLQACIALRHECPALRRGRFDVILTQPQLIVYRRTYEKQQVVVALNRGAADTTFTWPDSAPKLRQERLGRSQQALRPGKKHLVAGRSGRVWVS